jgi:hypothetical protein
VAGVWLTTIGTDRPLLERTSEYVYPAMDAESQLRAAYENLVAQNKANNRTHRCRIDPRVISDSIVGIAEGLTVPFAVTAALSVLDNPKLILLAGLADIAAGAVWLILGGFSKAGSEL